MIEDLCKDKDLTQFLGGCDVEMGVPDYLVLSLSMTEKITQTDAANLVQFIREKAADGDFVIPYGQIKRITDNSTEPTVGTLDKGYSKQLLAGRAIYLFEWPSSILNDRAISKLNRFKGGAFVINTDWLLVGAENEDDSMGPLPVEISVSGGGFAGSGGDVKTIQMTVDFGPQDMLLANCKVYGFKDTDRIDGIYPPPEP